MREDTAPPLLVAVLEVAVPLWIARLANVSEDRRAERAREIAQIIAEGGDVILYRGRKGESAAAFNALAEGVAILSFLPGGVTIFGLKFGGLSA